MQNKTDSFEISLEQRYIHNYFTFRPQKKLGNKFNVLDSQQAAGEGVPYQLFRESLFQ